MTKNCLSCSISQEPHIIWLSFMVENCKMVISPGVFCNVKILIFQVVKGLKGQIMDQNDEISVCHTLYFRSHKGKKLSKVTKNYVCLTPYLRNQAFIYCDFWYTCVKWWYLQLILSLFKILILGFFRGVKGQKMT